MLSGECSVSGHGALFTDLYELTMLQSYVQKGMERTAVFELFFRSLPAGRNFILAAGLDRVLNYLEQLAFTDDDLKFLASLPQFSREFVASLQDFRFLGDVHAVPEGTVVFPNEPILQVIAPLPQAQLVETLLLNQLSFASLAATKAARCVIAAEGRTVVDFGSRRAHGIDAALTASRASYLAGAAGTSLVESGRRYGIPTFGTMAHSYIQAHDDELQAFRDFAEMYPHTTLLVDTYDTLAGVQLVIDLHRQLGKKFSVAAVRLDSGDLADLGRRSRAMLDAAGLNQVKLFASGGLDEFAVAEFVRSGVPIDGFGIGTALAVSSDAPELDTAYKLVEYDGGPRTKLSSQKAVYPGRKQVFRQKRDGRNQRDVLARFDAAPGGEGLLTRVMHGGRRTAAGSLHLEEGRRRARQELAQLPDELRQLSQSENGYPVEVGEDLQADLDQLRRARRS